MKTIPPSPSVYFSPSGGTLSALIGLLADAQHTIDADLYELTSLPLAQALVAAAARGVAVRVVLDAREARARHSYSALAATGNVLVRECAHYHLMHDKVLLIDRQILATGSYNWSDDADQHNSENCLIVPLDGPWELLLSPYSRHHEKLWQQSTPLNPEPPSTTLTNTQLDTLRHLAAPQPLDQPPPPTTILTNAAGSPRS